jgi:formylglycine-generating enzyme required for sulfatase activity
VHRILGTVPVEADGSASFRVPANVPVAVQPLDAEGRAVQVMRSWYTSMPGEVISCVGCHERQNDGPPSKKTLATQRAPSAITPWYGPARGFSFKREVQPVLDRHCVGCHNGKPRPNRQAIPDFSRKPRNGWRNFTPAYIALHPFVRRPGPESDYRVQKPLEWHTSTSELIQMLKKGHHNVKLDAEAWDRLYTWIDLNVPDHGTWGEHRGIHANGRARRLAMRTKYANRPEDPEAYPGPAPKPAAFVKPAPMPPRPKAVAAPPGWPFGAAEAAKRRDAVGLPATREVDLGNGVKIGLVLIPAGTFVMGSTAGEVDEWKQAVVKIARPFYMSKHEITNAQFACADPAHDSGYISVFNKDHYNRGRAADRPEQPAVRLSWHQAMAFCTWLSGRAGRTFRLPTEAQWEYACRAGTATPLYYGPADADFGKLANLADGHVNQLTIRDSPNWIPCVAKVNDGAIVSRDVGSYPPNPWGLHDIHGNVAEWTLSLYRPYPYRSTDGRNDPASPGARVVRGGSWRDRPHRARSAFRVAYPAWQQVFNVGFRVVCEADPVGRRAPGKSRVAKR